MTADLISIAIVALIAALTPILANLIPGKAIPETVFLLIAGAILGPYALNIIQVSASVELLSDLGLGFLFLLAGYEINPKNITGSQGKRGFFTWLISLGLAFLVILFIPGIQGNEIEGVAIAIAMTTTALGTLLPILKERGLMNTRVGESILAYGTYGELGPVIAMALLLSTRAEWKTILILLGFVAIAVLAAVFSSRARKAGSKLIEFLSNNTNTTAQTALRFTFLLMAGLVALSALFDLDIVLGAFASGFVLRYVIPQGDSDLEMKLDGIAYGIFIPLFFVASGARIDLGAVVTQPLLLVGFIFMLLLIRAVPILVSLRTGRETRDMSSSSQITVALYCTTALPIIVAVTSVAVTAGAMQQSTASVLVSAGAITVFLMPFLASITYRVADGQPLVAVKEIAHNPSDLGSIIRDHVALARMLAKQDALMKATMFGRARRNEFVSRMSKWGAPTESLITNDHIKRASSVLDDEIIDVIRWEEAKRLGDEEWAVAKQQGDHTWERLKKEGDQRWETLKKTGDDTLQVQEEIPWQDQAALLQERAQLKAKAEEARDQLAQRAASARAANSSRVAERFAEEQMRRIEELRHLKESSNILQSNGHSKRRSIASRFPQKDAPKSKRDSSDGIGEGATEED